MCNAYIFDQFKEKVDLDESIIITDNIYKNTLFANFYNSIANESMNNDLEYYLSILTTKDKVLEIGTGNGRVLRPLLNNKIDIYGIEPEVEMLTFLTNLERKRVFNIGIEDISTLNTKYSHIIIPATSVSLFDENVFSNFLEDAKLILEDDGKIIFDFINPEAIEKLSGKVNLLKVKNQFFLAGNFKKNNQFIYNIYTKTLSNQKIIGYSIKYIYSSELVERLSGKHGYKSNLLKSSSNYLMMEVCNYAV